LLNIFVPLNPAATDGTQNAVGIAFGFVDVTLADAPGTAITRDAEVNSSELMWPPGITITQATMAIERLATNGIVAR
jgi:hypothetical protein